MADLRLITILPPQSVSGIQPPQVTGNLTPKGSLGNLQPGSIISGFIINRDSGGNPVLRTDSGDITFASNFFLKIGSEITIRIEHIAGSNSAHILTVNGQPPEVAVLQSGFAPDPEIIVSDNLKSSARQVAQQSASGAGATPVQTAPQNPTINISGTIISPAPAQTAQLPDNPALPPLPVGSQLSLKVVSLTQPAAAQTPQAQSPAVSVPSTPQAGSPENIVKNPVNPATLPTSVSDTPATGNAPTPPTATPYAAYARTNAATPANIPSPEIPAQNNAPQPAQTPQPQTQNPAQQVAATVISNDPNGEAIVSTPLGIIRLQAGTQLPIGSNVTFEISEIKTPEMLQNAANIIPAVNIARATAPLTELARSPGALGNIFTLLSGLGTQDAQDFINRNIPTAGQAPASANAGYNSIASGPSHNLLSSIFGYALAVSNGDFREWLGKANARWLEDNGHDDLLKKAEGEFSSIARQFTDAPPRSWQSLFFPVAVSGELQQARLFVKRDRKQKDSDGGSSGEEDTRFVVEMDLTQLGEMQLDGFVRNNSKSIRFDLIIRSNIALPDELQKDILAIYNNVGELTGYQGSLAFQAVKEFPVNPMEEIISGDHEGVVA